MIALWTILWFLLRCMQVYAIVTLFVNFVWYCCVNSTFLFVTVLGIQYALYLLPQPRIKDLTKKAVLITGCDTGIGNELAKRLDSLGFRVFAGCLKASNPSLESLKSSCSNKLHIIQLDVTKQEEVEAARKLVDGILNQTGDVLWGVINNAGIAYFGEVEWLSVAMYQEVLDVNLLGMIRVTQQFLPHLRQSRGRIVNASSAQGRFASPFSSAYSISKFGVEALGDTLRFELCKFGIKVIILEPGNFAKASAQFLPENMKKTMQRVWEQMSPELQKLYGKKYFNDVANAIAGTPDFSSPDLNMVIDDYIKALTLQSPKSRYMPATPLWKLIPLGLYFSPGWVGDFIFMSSLYLLKNSNPKNEKQ